MTEHLSRRQQSETGAMRAPGSHDGLDADALDLFRAFQQIDDPETRRSLIALARALAGHN